MLDCAQGVNKMSHCDFANEYHILNEIHVWMCMWRKMNARRNGQIIQNIVAALWKDALTHSKTITLCSMRLIQNQNEEIFKQFPYSIVSYDERLTKDDKQLSSAPCKCESNVDDIELKVKMKTADVHMHTIDRKNNLTAATKFVWINRSEMRCLKRQVN